MTVDWNQIVDTSDDTNDAPIDKYQLLQVPLSKLIAEGGADNDEFGYSVAVYRDTAVIGPHQHDVNGNVNAGAAYVFTRGSSGWVQRARLSAEDGTNNDEFGISVAVDGDTVVVGAYGDDGNRGAAYVFTKTGGAWTSTTTAAKLTGSGTTGGDRFGHSVAVVGDTVVVGAYQHDVNRGAAYVFTKTGGAWTSTTTAAKLTASDGEANDEFGVSVAVDEDTVAVGAHLHDLDVDGASMLDAGAVYVFTKPAAGWTSSTESAKLTATDGAAGDEFGISVAIDGDTVVTGAYRDDSMATDSDDGLDSGSVYVFDRDPESGKWSQTAKLTASNGDGGDGFGNSVAVDGDTTVVGAYLDDNRGIVLTDSGSVYVFTNQSGVWSEALNLAGPKAEQHDRFGRSVAVYRGIVLAGVPQVDEDRPDAGSAYVMDISNAMWEDLKAEELTVSYEVKDLSVEEDYFYRVLDLTNDQEYAFRVRSVNAAGNHPSAETVSATPKLGRPVKPTGLVAEARDRAVELSWDLSDDSTIKHYQVLQHPEQSRFTASDGADSDQFGSAVAVDGGTAVVGAPQDDDNGDNSGSAYVFTRHPLSGIWGQKAKLTASDRDANDYFGSSVAVRGGTIVVGAYAANIDVCDPDESDDDDCDEDPRSGAAYLFTKLANVDWVNDPNKDHRTESDKLTLPIEEGAVEKSDEFGNSVALDGQSIVVGAPEGNDGFGTVYVSDIPEWAHIDDSKATTVSHRVTDLENGVKYTFQVRAVDKVSDVGESPPSNIARATPLVRNHAPEFDLGDSVTFAVDEEEPPGNHVGSAVTATDPEGDTLAYSLSGTHASSFDIDASNGQIAVGSGTTLDYESGLREYSVIVSVHDRLDTDGDQDTTNDDSIDVTINVNNVDEAGTVSMSTTWLREGTTLSASLTDPDGSVSDTSWQWARSANGSTGWRDIVRANSYRYRPVANDGGNYLRATASYTDGHGSGKEAAVVSTNRVRSLDRPETSPPPTPTPVPITVVPPGVGDAAVPPGLLLVIGLMGMLLVIAGSIVVRERRSNRRL